MSTQFTFATAVRDFPPAPLVRERSHLGFTDGDVIKIVGKVSNPPAGATQIWYAGELDGKTGIFPSNFVIPRWRWTQPPPPVVKKHASE